MISQKLYHYLVTQFSMNPDSTHGTGHWKRVETLGIYLAKQTHANSSVISHFAYIHDSKRLNELYDPEHGKRAALFCDELSEEGKLTLNTKLLNQLKTACEIHSYNRLKPSDITIATCLDADRLDIIRLQMAPSPEFLFTEEAKRLSNEGIDTIDRIANQTNTEENSR